MKNMCYHPWVGMEISTQGNIKPCCKYTHPIANNIKVYQNSQELKQLQEDLLAGKKPAGCQKCWNDEQAGIPSKRQIDWKHVFDETVPKLDKLKVLMFPFGNSCNLACRTCGSDSSSTWIKEGKKLKKHFPDLKIYSHQRFYQDKEFMSDIKNLCSDIKHVYFPGGEPFLTGIDEHIDFLDYLLEHHPETITLHYITNTTIFPKKKFWERWGKFKHVDIHLSIDGIQEHFEYTRWPAKWEEVNSNIRLYQDKKQKMSNLQLTLGHVVSIFTVYYVPEFYKWCLQNQFEYPYISLVSYPRIYDIRTLPVLVKDVVAEKLNRFNFKEIVSYMYQTDFSKDFDETIDYIQILDQHRNQNFSRTFPEFYQLLKDAECQI